MQICPNCGEENPERFRLCGFCGAALAPQLPPQEERKTVTIVFSDLKGSTSLGEKLDPESLREVMTRYFDAMTAVLRRHGGTIEKFIGDAGYVTFPREVRSGSGYLKPSAGTSLSVDRGLCQSRVDQRISHAATREIAGNRGNECVALQRERLDSISGNHRSRARNIAEQRDLAA